jgi:hypothetical protein
MTLERRSVPKWILILSGILALLELMVSGLLCFSPESAVEQADLNARGVDYLIYMWAARQLALGVILAYATIKRSAPMLTIAYIFLLVMFAGDLAIGFWQGETSLIAAAVVMCALSAAVLFALKKNR